MAGGNQLRHGAKRLSPKVQIKSGTDDPVTLIRQLSTYFRNRMIKKLGFVNGYVFYFSIPKI
jgi:hypothetical protein